ncbi:MAG: fibronectin type III domain-containing protein, partial [Candidatus Heimdallarchaeota archaeon]
GINEEFFGKSINSVVNSSVDATSEKITWQTDGNVTSIVKYGFSINDLNKEVKIESFANSHVVYLTNLFPNTTYYYQVFGLDIFTNMINDSINQFQTPATTTGFPIISNVKITSITNTNAIVTVDTDIISNATLFYSSNKTEVLDNSAVGQIVPALLPNRTDFTFNIADAGSLDPGTEYYFYIKAESGSNVSYNNNSVLFSFVTKTSGIASVLGPLISLFNETHAQINFTTNININATIYYTNDYYSRNDLSGATLIWYPNATTQSIFLKVEPGTRYFFKIGLKNDTKEFWIINQNLNEYFSFTTNPPVEKNEALIDITLQIPNYPAVLGVWTFSLQLNQINKSMANPPNEKPYSITFIVNTSLKFNFKKLLIQTGEIMNDTGTFEEWDEFNVTDLSNEVFSPGDNIGIIGSLAYSTDQVNEINNSDFLYSGNVDLYSGLEKLNSEQFLITEIDSNPINYNITGISGVNNNTMKFMRLNIPSTDIYGNTSVNFTLKFPNVNPAKDYIQSESYFNLNVKYRLGVSKTTGKSSYQLTSTNVVGSATIIPYHWSDLKVKYSN